MIIQDAVDLYYEAFGIYEKDRGKTIKDSEEEVFRKLIFACAGSVQQKGRVARILRNFGVKTRNDFVKAGLGEMLMLKGLGNTGRKILLELTGKTIAVESIRQLPIRL